MYLPLCRPFDLTAHPPIHVASGTHLHFECYGAQLNLFSSRRRYGIVPEIPANVPSTAGLLGVNATLSFSGCDVSTFANEAAAEQVPVGRQMPLYLWGNAPGAVVHVVDSTVRAPCAVCAPDM